MISKNKLYSIILVSVAMILMLASIAGADPYAYITNYGDNTVSVINTTTNTVTNSVDVGIGPYGVSVTPTGGNVYVANNGSNNVSVINTTKNIVYASVTVGSNPVGVVYIPFIEDVYVANMGSNTVSVINSTTKTVTNNVNVGTKPVGVAAVPISTNKSIKDVYVANMGSNNISIINATTKTVTNSVKVGTNPVGVIFIPVTNELYGNEVYVTNKGSNNVSVINKTTKTVTATVNVGTNPVGVTVTPDGSTVYVANMGSNNISVINTTTKTVTNSVSVGSNPVGVSVSPDGTEVYVTNKGSNNISIINATTKTITNSVNVGNNPIAFGLFIGPGTPALNITKVANQTTYIAAGQQITYTFNVTNIGNMPTTGPINVTDNQINGGIPFEISATGLSLGQSVMGTATYTTTQQDINNGSMTNLANATGSVFDSIFLWLPVTSNNTNVTLFATGQEPDAHFRINQTEGPVPLDVQFTDRTTGEPTSWYWDFGDGTNSTQQNPEHIYNTAGIYTPILTASNEVGTSTKVSTVPITAMSMPDAHFRINQTEGPVPLDVQFTDRTTGEPTSWYWDFGDGTNSTQQNPEHIYNTAGIYTPILTASNEVGTSTKVSTVPITAMSMPDAHFRINQTEGPVPLDVQFTDRTTGEPTSWYWDFGDGTNSTQQNPEHIYNTAGIYTPILTASNEVGTSTKVSTVPITAMSMPDAHFRINQTEGPVPLDVQFTDRTTGEPTSWYWDFGDGTNSTQQNPEHIYNTAGIYTPILTASNEVGTSTKVSTVPITVT